MNIQIPYTWLLEYLDTDASIDEIARSLSLCGPSVERILTLENEPVFDIEVTTNRVDMMSIYGIAREASVILPEFGYKARLKPINIDETFINLASTQAPLALKIVNDPKVCHRILAVKLSNLALDDSPPLVKKRLLQIGARPLNNAIDITNYVMWELGHPIHAFDFDRLTSKTIIVREAKKDEQLTTLDGKTHRLLGGEIIFDDSHGKIIDLPGIMGTQNTVVTQKTKNVLLWIESITAKKIRSASMGLAIRSQAAVLNEKNVDPHLAGPALNRAMTLFKTNTQAKVGSQIFDEFPDKHQPQPISLKQSQLDAYLGVAVPSKKVVRILAGLGCQVTTQPDSQSPSTYSITPPTYRQNDLTIPQDFIEEVARIYGYHNLPSVVMPTQIPDHPTDSNFTLENQIRQYLSGWGAQETYSYSMVSDALAKASGYPLKDHLKIANPLTQDRCYLRRALLPSLHEILLQNPTAHTTLFELQNTYHPRTNQLPQESLRLALISNLGNAASSSSAVKGLLEALAQKLHLPSLEFKPTASHAMPYETHNAADVYCQAHCIGHYGQVRGSQLNIFGFDLDIPTLSKLYRSYPEFKPLVQTPPIIEDLTFKLPLHTHLGPVISAIQSHHHLIVNVSLSGQYQQNFTFTLTYQDPQKSLKDTDITPIRKGIVALLKQKFSAQLIGTLD